MYQSLVVDILAGKSLLELVGPEGVGKSHLLAVLAERLPGSQQVVLLDTPVGALSELVQPLLGAPGEQAPTPEDEEQAVAAVLEHVAQARAQQKRVVLLVDAVEQLTPEILAGLVQLVGTKGGDTGLSLVLAGREGLTATLAQLAAEGQPAVAETYTLEPLSESETRQYLRFCASEAGMSREDYAEVFNDGVVTKIAKTAQGNMRLIHILAEEALENSCEEKSFMVLLDQVEPDGAEPQVHPSPLGKLVALFRIRPLLGGGAIGAFVLALALAVFFFQPEDTPVPPADATKAELVNPSPEKGASPAQQSMFAANLEKGKQLFQERLAAGDQWLTGDSAEKYTLQLMVLSSSSAEYSLGHELVSTAYAPILDQLYIMSNLQSPPTLFVFYGMYDSLEAAREARNTMPLFLQQQGPYPLAIGDAVAKVRPNP